MSDDIRQNLGKRFARKKESETGQAGPTARRALSSVAEREKKKQRILLELENLPSLPSVVIEVMKLIQDPDSTAKDFEEHVRKDQALAGKMLKLVNSSFYSLSRKISTISEAVVILGFNTLKSLVLATSTRKILERPLTGYGYEERGLWKHSISCAGGSKYLAREMGLGDMVSEELFVAGLLHDLGKLILGPMVEEQVDAFRARVAGGETVLEAERATTDFDHAMVAGLILRKWKLSDDLGDVILHHHAPTAAKIHPRRTAIVHIVDYVANRLRLGMTEAYPGPTPLDPQAYATIGLPDDKFKEVLGRMEEAMKDMQRLFSEIE